ncbi:MAG: hypothetical protein LBD78_01325, partial [Spirochaetaceae bacterium]|nr:hypothetical protein [Spirochaetaceae bacterium]
MQKSLFRDKTLRTSGTGGPAGPFLHKPGCFWFLWLFFSLSTGILPGKEPGEVPGTEEPDRLSAFADPARIWGGGVEGLVEEAYRLSFKTYIIGGRVMNLRMPFAQNNERDELAGQGWDFLGGGKADPRYLWGVIDGILGGEDFFRYTETLSGGRETVIIFDIPTRTWTSSRDLFDIARMKAGAYRGLPHRPYVLVSGRGIGETDVYNYLYCIGWVGMDCSGFVWHVLSHVARAGGLDLGRTLGRALGT